jgi:hypothetical protein
MRLSPLQRKEIAEKVLAWLKERDISICNNSHDILTQCANNINEPLYDLWKAYELLRIMGRIELNNPNGRKGFRVLDYTPLSVYQLRTDGFKKQVQKDMLIRILSNLKKQYADIWNECLKGTEGKI